MRGGGLVVNTTARQDDSVTIYTTDKTAREIKEAFLSGKSVIITITTELKAEWTQILAWDEVGAFYVAYGTGTQFAAESLEDFMEYEKDSTSPS